MNQIDITAVRKWLEHIPGGSLAERYETEWTAFERLDRPVVTLFGAYDTGKSSLLRRLLIDAGAQVPEWLTISARHETFEVNEVELAGCIARDTPGFVVGASDIRAQNNSERALAAVGLTDIGVAVLTPQLATAERDVLREVACAGWPEGALWFVISRFDEAGANPEYDADGYRELGDRKVRELLDVFDQVDRERVYVVAQDPFQTAGPDLDVDREEWDAYRDWDGMRELADAIEQISTASLSGLRRAAGQRYWKAVVSEVLRELHDRLAEFTASAEVASHGVARRNSWLSELEVLDRAARADLNGLVEEVFDQSWTAQDNSARDLQREIEIALDRWFTKHEARLQRLKTSIGKAGDRDRARPSWDGFVSLVASVDSAPTVDPNSGYSRHVEDLGPMLIALLKATQGVQEKASSAKGSNHTVRGVAIAEAAFPVALYIAKIVDDRNAAMAGGQGAAAYSLTEAVSECTRQANDAWAPFVEDVRALIDAESGEQAALDESLRRIVQDLETAVQEGSNL
ncbi:hypothetical protein GDN83_08515 [Gordonia jinghuaiqii]|uniref:GTPase domain-containing protein n=1 Tax=Gordonia jinghuaiqii TaxID=2758710 RepID=A0A7D7LV90_9ACTN|nr:GTPase domain-containing protein [Gordonia jinghuaiqii]MCR5977781.1 hypothetical protein [Gordonia jinghuaiqii]QMT02441.1 GTPase domain-containing protein [Gordonia jinghuaiqii]